MMLLTTAVLTATLGAGGMVQMAAADPFEACKADFQANCQGVRPGGGRIKVCLEKHADKLSPACRAALSQADKS